MIIERACATTGFYDNGGMGEIDGFFAVSDSVPSTSTRFVPLAAGETNSTGVGPPNQKLNVP